MKTLSLIFLSLLFSFMAEASTIHVKTITLKTAGSEQSYYLLYTVDKSYEYDMADSVSGKHLISRHVLAERYNILDTILNSSNTNLNESIILKAYEFPGLNITIESPETGSNETFLYWGFIKQKLITVVDFTCHYEKNKNPHMIMSKSETKSYTEKTFFFWSIVILFILFWFGAWLYSLIYKIIKGKKIDFALDTAGEVIAYLIFFWITVASINQSIKCGPKFCLIALFAFLLPAITSLIIKLKPKK